MSKNCGKDALRGDLVQIHKVILTPEQRPENLPACTRVVSYEGWIKGFLLDDEAKVGDKVRVETFIGREVSGTLVEVNPAYDHKFGQPQRNLISAAIKAREQIERRSAHGE